MTAPEKLKRLPSRPFALTISPSVRNERIRELLTSSPFGKILLFRNDRKSEFPSQSEQLSEAGFTVPAESVVVSFDDFTYSNAVNDIVNIKFAKRLTRKLIRKRNDERYIDTKLSKQLDFFLVRRQQFDPVRFSVSIILLLVPNNFFWVRVERDDNALSISLLCSLNHLPNNFLMRKVNAVKSSD